MATRLERRPAMRPERPRAALLEASALTPHHEAIARLLWHAELRGEPVEPLSATFPELEVEDAYRVQAIGRELRTAQGEELRGWKVGLTSQAMQEMMGVDQPDGGYLLESMVVQSGAQLRGERFIQARVEAEIAFLLKAPLEGLSVTREEVLAATQAFAPALELIDSRITQWRIGIVDTVADNASSGMAVIGDWHDAEDVRVEELGVSLALGPEVVRGRGDAVLGHPAEAVAWLAGTLAGQGERLEPGDVVLPGSVARAVPIARGQAAYATFDRLGEVSVRLV
jgi:2-keto-4-pentenoate hydratase